MEQGMGFLPAWCAHPSQQVQIHLTEVLVLYWGQGKLFAGQKELINNKKIRLSRYQERWAERKAFTGASVR